MSNQAQSVLYSVNFIVLAFFTKKFRLVSTYQFIGLLFLLSLNLIVSIFTQDKYVLESLLVYIILEFFLMIFYLKSWIIPTLYMIIQLFVVMAIWTLTINIPMMIFDIKVSGYFEFAEAIIQSLLILLLYYFFKKANQRLKLWEFLNYQKKRYKILSIVILFLFFSISVIHGVASANKQWVLSTYSLIVLGVLCFGIFTSLYFVKRDKEQKEYLTSLTTFYNQEQAKYKYLRAFKHDFKDLIISVEACLEQHDYSEAKTLIRRITQSTDNIMDEKININDIKNTSLRGLLIHYYNRGVEREIDFRINILGEFDVKDFILVDVIRCLSIVLSNAEEETEKLKYHKKIIFVDIKKNGNNVFFIVKNNYENKIDIHEIFKRGYSTKDEHRGIGLNTIRNIESENRGLQFNLQIDREVFCAEIHMTIDFD
ncbi:GHKL domain-containing protein [Enterococcus hulanensis]|uniref:sensor histidine kinase n=1 Tax=Enterococcus hulanensis TaxID=2559929 RepID=UPI001A90AFCB|nr:GHKL domain-containing protein [Enterococcus hulanensis]MBO0459403.1 GHKL domain-containing protein [Enterococcus hulanensis]